MQNRKNWKRRVFDIIQVGNVSDLPSRAFDYTLAIAILLNIVSMFLETFDSLKSAWPFLSAVENVTLGFFCMEYVLRLWTSEYRYPMVSRGKAMLRFMISFDGIVEILTILPMFFLYGAVAFRILRVVRILHLFRINARMDSFSIITQVLKEKKNQMMFSLIIILVLMLASSMFMYALEHDAQPDKFQNALSGMWWSVSALLTVGYGDIYPITPLGRVFAVVLSFLGVLAVAIPTGILSAGFVEHYTRAQTAGDEDVKCMTIREDSRWLDMEREAVERDAGMALLMVSREGKAFRPGQDFRVRVHDKLIFWDDLNVP